MTESYDDQIEALNVRVEYLMSALRTQGQEMSKLAATNITLEQRLEKLELAGGQIKRTGDVPLWMQEAVNKGISQLKGKLTASEAAERLGIPTDHATLIRLGRYFQTLGIRRGRDGTRRYFWFVV